MNTTQTNKYFVVSLPRTGTKSLCRMVGMMGVEYRHVPSVALPRMLRQNEAHFFADTPIFAPSTFIELAKEESHKFIYINRPIHEWIDSFERVSMPQNYMALHTGLIAENGVNKMDRLCLEEIFNNEDYTHDGALEAYHRHYEAVITNISADRLLEYRFSDGWGPLASFMGLEAPSDAPVPHINKNTMYDVI